MRPIIAQRANDAIKALILLPSERKAEGNEDDKKVPGDSDLRARIREAEWMLSAFENEVRIFDINRARDEAERNDGANPQ